MYQNQSNQIEVRNTSNRSHTITNQMKTLILLILSSFSLFSAAQEREKPYVVLNDPLNLKTSGLIKGGEFMPDGGWAANEDNAMILWLLPSFGPDGMLEFDVRNFDPPNQVTTEKQNFIGLWGKLFNNLEGQNLPGTDGIELRIGTSEKQFKVEYHAMGLGRVRHWEPVPDADFDPDHTYHFKIVWQNGVVTISIDNLEPLVFPGIPEDPIDHFGFLHLGTSPHFGGHCTRGPVYSNIVITAL